MAAGSTDHDYPPAVLLLTSATVGAVSVVASILAFNLLVGDAATRTAELERITSYMYWTQPFIYAMAGLIAGSGDPRRGPIRAPVVGLLLASICWMALRKQNLLPSESNVVTYLMTAGALFSLGGAMVAPLIKERVGRTVGVILLIGVLAFGWTFLNLGSISGDVQRDVIIRVEGQAQSWQTVGVPGARVALLDDAGTLLYSVHTNGSGRYHIGRAPTGDYTLRVWDPTTPAVLNQQVTVTRSITGGTRWESVALPTLSEETGPLFE